MRAIYKRELASYFHSMIGYLFIAFLIAYTGIYFMVYNLNYGYPYFSYVLTGVNFILLIAVPILTMKSFAEDRRNKTDQMLLTAPVSLFKIVMGKYLAMITILVIPCIIYLLFPLLIKMQGNAYIVVDYLSVLVFFLMGCVYIAIGMFISSLTESPIIAAIATFGALLLLHLWSGILDFLPQNAIGNVCGIVLILTLLISGIYQMTKNWLLSVILEAVSIAACIVIYVVKSSVFEGALTDLFGKLALSETLNNVVSSHLLDLSGIILNVSLAGLFIFLTMQMIQKRRWS